MLSVCLITPRDGNNRTHKAFSTAILLFLRVSKPIGLGFSGGRYTGNREVRRCCWAKVIWVMSDNLDADPQEGPS